MRRETRAPAMWEDVPPQRKDPRLRRGNPGGGDKLMGEMTAGDGGEDSRDGEPARGRGDAQVPRRKRF